METVELADNSPLEEADRSGSPSLIPTYHFVVTLLHIPCSEHLAPCRSFVRAKELGLTSCASSGHGIAMPRSAALDQRTVCSCTYLAFPAPPANFAVQASLASNFGQQAAWSLCCVGDPLICPTPSHPPGPSCCTGTQRQARAARRWTPVLARRWRSSCSMRSS